LVSSVMTFSGILVSCPCPISGFGDEKSRVQW
jgi:hypothetical protein